MRLQFALCCICGFNQGERRSDILDKLQIYHRLDGRRSFYSTFNEYSPHSFQVFFLPSVGVTMLLVCAYFKFSCVSPSCKQAKRRPNVACVQVSDERILCCFVSNLPSWQCRKMGLVYFSCISNDIEGMLPDFQLQFHHEPFIPIDRLNIIMQKGNRLNYH